MGLPVCNGAMLQCSFGALPSTLTVLPIGRPMVGAAPMANVNDKVPFLNIAPFGVCSSLLNPAVASATAAALGVLTPMPCTPVLPAPWVPPSPKVLVARIPAFDNNAKCACAYGGVISVAVPGQFKVTMS